MLLILWAMIAMIGPCVFIIVIINFFSTFAYIFGILYNDCFEIKILTNNIL